MNAIRYAIKVNVQPTWLYWIYIGCVSYWKDVSWPEAVVRANVLPNPRHNARMWASNKFCGLGFRYGVAIENGDICWMSGPFPCGSYLDHVIFRCDIANWLVGSESVAGEEVYKDYRCVLHEEMDREKDKCVHFGIRSSHENINELLKNFNAIKSRFRHHRSLHSFCFHAVASITHFVITQKHPLPALL